MNNSTSSVTLRVVFMGTPHFSVGILESMKRANINIVGIVTVADKPAGRGMQMHESPVKQFALENNISILQPVKLKDPEFISSLKEWNADLFVVVAFRMLPEEVWSMPKYGTFNLHASLLPDYRGAAPINWTLINGDKKTGLSTFFIDKEIDTGNVIQQVEIPIDNDDNFGTLHDKMMKLGGLLVVDTIEKIANSKVETKSQSAFTTSLMRPAPKLTKENTLIDWGKSAHEITNHVRGLTPYPSAWTIWKNKQGENKVIKIQEVRLTDEKGSGSLELSSTKRQLYIDTREQKLEIVEFQIEGKKKMISKDWLLGNNATDWEIFKS